MSRETSTFSDVDPMTIRQPAPLAIGLFGYGGSGKTESALRIAFGIARVYGGDVFYADTENRKGLAYRRLFPTMRYIDFGPPHNALRYVELIRTYSQRRGVLVIDQFTEEHDGEGGLLDTQEEAKQGKESRNAVAWAVAKGQHKRLARELRKALSTIPIVGTWRAEDKTDWNHKDDRGRVTPEPIGQMPLGSKDIPFEMTANYLLRAGARGMPCLTPETRGEHVMTKIPRWFADVVRPGEAFTEDHGEAFARWAMSEAEHPDVARLGAAIDAAPDDAAVDAAGKEAAALVRARALTKADLEKLSARARARRAVLRGEVAAPASTVPPARPTPRTDEPPAREPGVD